METILKVKDMEKSVPEQELPILKKVSLHVQEKEFVAIMGPSGSGKSTLLYCVSGMDRVTNGQVIFNGADITKYTEKQLAQLRLHHIGFVFQHMYLLHHLTVVENIILPGYLAKRESRGKVIEYAYNLMTQLEINHLSEQAITSISGGQLQRVAICRALINRPTIIFADEPTGALDSQATEEVMSILDTINRQGTTVVMVTHDPHVAAYANRIFYMKDGTIINEKQNKKSMNLTEREENLADWLQGMK
ncbi:ABC transporter ATP-binding protein [Gracilibacillus sp. HCP3S3_G5_1]|uniref:ABC transporter ATP-binding protein n=1 Tax=unclassified Gracilibacillus TaxID=2625209 RepID=UPI003F88DB02